MLKTTEDREKALHQRTAHLEAIAQLTVQLEQLREQKRKVSNILSTEMDKLKAITAMINDYDAKEGSQQ